MITLHACNTQLQELQEMPNIIIFSVSMQFSF